MQFTPQELDPLHEAPANNQPTPDSAEPIDVDRRAAPTRLVPGITMAAIATAISLGVAALAALLGASFVSPLIISLVLGAVVGSTWRVPAPARAGTAWTARHVLRAGIVLLGLDLSVGQLLGIGWGGAVVIVLTVVCTFLGTLAVGRLLGIGSRTRLYVATGFAICGAAAIAAMEATMSEFDEADESDEPAPSEVTEAALRETRGADGETIDSRPGAEAVAVVLATSAPSQTACEPDELPQDVREAQAELRRSAREAANANALGTALALVTVYGALLVALLPWLAGLLGLSDEQAGLWIGASTHEVAHVVAAGGLVSSVALAAATISKLGRVVLLAPLVTFVSLVMARRRRLGERKVDRQGFAAGAMRKKRRVSPVPVFVLGFLAAILVRSSGVLPDVVLTVASGVSKTLLTAAMFALGTTIDIPVLVRTGRPALLLGGISTTIAVGLSLGGVLLLG